MAAPRSGPAALPSATRAKPSSPPPPTSSPPAASTASSVDDIARAAGVNKAMIYYHFADKLALYRAIVRDMLRADRRRASPRSPTAPAAADDKHRRRSSPRFVSQTRRAPVVSAADAARNRRRRAAPRPRHPGADARRVRRLRPHPRRRAGRPGVFRHVHPVLAYMSIIGPLMINAARERAAAQPGRQRASDVRRRSARRARRATCRTPRSACCRRCAAERPLMPRMTRVARSPPRFVAARRACSEPPPSNDGSASRATSRPPTCGSRPRPAAASSPSTSRKATACSPAQRSSRSTRATSQLAIDAREAERPQAEAQLRLVQAGARPEDVRQARGAGRQRRAPKCRRRRPSCSRRRAGPRALRDAAQEQLGLAQAARRCGDAARRGERPRDGGARAGCGRPSEALARLQCRRAAAKRSTPRAPASPPSPRRSPSLEKSLADATLTVAGRRHRHREARRGRRDDRAAHARSSSSPISITPGPTSSCPSRPCRGCALGQPATRLHRRRRRRHRRHDHLHLAEGGVHAAQRADRRGALEARLPRPHRVDNKDGVLKQGMPVEAELAAAAAVGAA